MTSLSPDTRILRTCGTLTAGLLLGLALPGCGSDDTPRPVTAAPPPAPRQAPPPQPAVVPVAQLMAQLGIDERVRLPEQQAPDSTQARKAVLEFFDAFARGDTAALRGMLSGLDREELESLVASGSWEDTTQKIERIEVQTGRSPEGQACALAVFYVGETFQPQLWYYDVTGGEPVFNAVAAPPNLMARLHGTDWIARWFEILEEELALADKPDEEFTVPQKDYSTTSEGGGTYSGPRGTSPSSPTSPASPSSPTMPGRRPRGPKRAPPGPG